MKKTLTIICLLILVASVLMLVGCKTTEEPEERVEEVVEEPELEVEEVVEEPEEVEEPEVAESAELLSDLKCVDTRIEGTVTNVLDEQIDLSDAKVFINGILKRGVECDEMVLEPGESTSCTNLIGSRKASSLKTNKVDFRIDSASQVELIECVEEKTTETEVVEEEPAEETDTKETEEPEE